MQVYHLDHHILCPSRCSLEKWNDLGYDYQNDLNPETEKDGIRCHNWLTAFFLQIIGKISTFKLENGGKVYLNKNSFLKWKKWRTLPITPQDLDLAKIVTPPTSPRHEESPVSSPLSSQRSDEGSIKKPPFTRNPVLSPNPVPKEDDPFVEEASIIKQEQQPKTSTTLDQVIEMISNKSHKDLSEIWSNFFSHFKSDVVKGWRKEDKNTFIFTLSRQLKVWIDSEDGPKGGTIFIIGDHENELKVKLKSEKMKFESGFTLFCSTGVMNQNVTVYQMEKDEDQIRFKAGLNPILSKTKEKPTSEYLEKWATGIALEEKTDHVAFLKTKQKENK